MHLFNFANLIIGALLGVGASELYAFIQRKHKYQEITKTLKPYVGSYDVKTKNNLPSQLISAEITLGSDNLLNLKLTTEKNGIAEGRIIFSDSNFNFGTCNYHHIDPEKNNLSGFYYLSFFSNNLIHATKSYLKETGETVNEVYIWKKEN